MIYETLLVPLLSTSQNIDTWASALCLNTTNHGRAIINSVDNRKQHVFYLQHVCFSFFFPHDQARGYYGQSPLGMSDKIDLKLMLDRQDLEVPKLS